VALVAIVHHQAILTNVIAVITTIWRHIATAMIGMLINVIEPMSPIMVTTRRLIKGQTTISITTFRHGIYVTTSISASTTR
jgi:hypothetical protein